MFGFLHLPGYGPSSRRRLRSGKASSENHKKLLNTLNSETSTLSGASQQKKMTNEEDVFTFQDTGHPDHLMSGLQELRKECRFSDVIICVGATEFPCHRVVLASASSYFKAMFSGELRESLATKIVIHSVSEDIMELLLEFSYTGRVDITQKNVEALLEAANLFQFGTVREACSRYLQQRIDASNVLGFHEFAEAHNCTELSELAKEFVIDNFLEVFQTSGEFLQVTQERLVEYISDVNLQIDKEEQVYESVMQWVRADVDNRLSILHKVLEHVRLPFINPRYLVAKVETEPLILSSPACMELVQEARRYHVFDYDRADNPNIRMKPRPCFDISEAMVVVGGCSGGDTKLAKVDCYDPKNNAWHTLSDLPEYNREGYAVVALGNDIYVTGTTDETITSDGCATTWKYSTQSDRWMTMAPMLKSYKCRATVVLHGQIYLLGGTDINGPVADVERYDPFSNSWEEVQSMIKAMNDFTVAACRGKLYVNGRSQGSEKILFQCFDPSTDTWNFIDNSVMPEWSQVPQSITLNGLIYYLRDDSKEVDAYDPIANQWVEVAPMKAMHSSGSVCVIDGKIFVSGGFGELAESNLIECYDPTYDKWAYSGSLPEPRCYHWCVSILKKVEHKDEEE
ncbi:kelch-like protein 21 isoform X1 [Branchiostoma floridae]|uniref:Kelch-like protein 21 n=2 Tax=Branchiostoma floridae TaxID=7739 RepID=A0A9J7MA44_BRAFL|nr:kelch-like protein 21 isoform X1 [Branchiostoma floridae]